MAQKKTNHKPFLDTVERIARAGEGYKVDRHEVKTLLGHAKWLVAWIESKRRASASRVTFGAKRKPDSEVKPETLKKREYRDRKKAQQEGI